ncbi:MAG: glycosyltransferase family 9 protein [Melioribacteraceae bacterium]|nr:glycosyltransferase family 9 protein [Melioribacteraceae bacterium]
MLNVKKILIIRLSALGDILLTTPVIRSIKNKYPNAEIDFLLKKDYFDAIKYNPNINNILLFGGANPLTHYDIIIDLQNNRVSRSIVSKYKPSSYSTKVYRFSKPQLKKFMLVNFKINLYKEILQIPERYTASIPDLMLDDKGLDLFLGDYGYMELEKGEYIGFAPGSRHFTKRYPIKYFSELGNLFAEMGFKILIFGGVSDQIICRELAYKIPGSINLCNDNQLLLTSRYMNECKFVITNDSGLMHVASALRVPVVALFGSSVKEFGFAPYKTKNLLLENNSLSCRPCSHYGREECPKKHFNCMMKLIPSLVYKKTIEFMEI